MQGHMPELLSADQMQAVDRRAAESGVDTYTLMQAAGRAVANQVLAIAPRAPVITILVGTGNNGGDGYIAATELSRLGCDVMIIGLAREPRAGSDAARAKASCPIPDIRIAADVERLPDDVVARMATSDVIVDALFGAGLARPISGSYRLLIQELAKVQETTDVHVLAVDLPSGLDGNSLIAQDVAVRADSTVTFFRYKLAHIVSTGRQQCGDIVLCQIGLTRRHLQSDVAYVRLNSPPEFVEHLPVLPVDTHKYTRGAVLVRGGPMECTGAARLSADAALRCGAGLVTLATRSNALAINAAHLTAVMLTVCDDNDAWQQLLEDTRWRVVVLGPGNGVDQAMRDAVLAALSSKLSCVLDADALSCWQGHRESLYAALCNAGQTPVLTPHAGEFERLFGVDQSTPQGSQTKIARAQAASARTGSVIVFKGADTVIASPDGRVSINNNAPPWLATAGAGDVLAGIIAALIAQGMPSFEASRAAVWVHGEAAVNLRCPMTAEQLAPAAADVLSGLLP